MIRRTTLSLLVYAMVTSVQAQSINYVTEVVTTYNGYWRSANAGTSTTITNSIQPDSSHYLLAFSSNGVRYSTGVSDARLINNGLSFTPGQYQALPVAAISTAPTSNTKIGLGQLYDKVNNGASNPPPVRDLARYLTDGPQGLDLGTGVANIPAGTLTFPVSKVQATAINDGTPDILITQFADPAGSSDVYSFRDAANALVGTAVTVTYDSSFPIVGRWLADFYEASQNPMVLGTGFTKTPRDLRLWTADFATFNIPASDYSRIATFQIQLSGNSDVAFVAYNTRALTVLPVELTLFNGRIQEDGQVQLTWRTASELNSEAFVVEVSTDGYTFTPIGRVAAAGNKTTNTEYTYRHRPMTTGLVYYRLHQLDQDGRNAYSPVVVVSIGAAIVQPISITPNPFQQTLQLQQLPSGAVCGEARLWAMDGRPLYQHPFRADELGSSSAILADLPALPPGLYVLEVVVDGRSTRQKLLKQ